MVRSIAEEHFKVAQLKRKAIQSSKQIIVLIHSSKFGKENLTLFAQPIRIEHLFTGAGVSNEWKTLLQEVNISFNVRAKNPFST